jgi:SPX domain protein involved in polyphosphate accumulation
MPNLFNNDFLDFLKLLEKHDVDFLLVGGYAVILHGYTRSTGDLDLWVKKSSDNYNNLKKAYTDFGAPIFSEEDFESEKLDVWGIGVEPRKIEILTHVDGLLFNESKKNCKMLELEKLKVPYIDFDDLIKNKLATGRYKDLADVEQLKINKKVD